MQLNDALHYYCIILKQKP